MSDNVANRRVSNRVQHGFEPNNAPTPQYGAASHGSEYSTTPVDKEGIPFLTKEHIGSIYGRSPGNAKKVAWETTAPHYTYDRGNFRTENASVYYSHGEIVNHLAKLGGVDKPEEQRTHEEKGWSRVHADELSKYTAKKKEIAATRKAGGPVFNLENQPHPANRGFAGPRLTHYPNGRVDKDASEQLGEVSLTSDRRRVEGVPYTPTKSRAKKRSS